NPAHLALEYVDDLRELIDPILAQEMADAGDSWIGSLGKGLPGAFRAHRSELPNAEYPAAIAHARLPEEDRARTVELDKKPDNGESRQEKWQDDQTEHDVGAAFHLGVKR